jgi:hypothetical protein
MPARLLVSLQFVSLPRKVADQSSSIVSCDRTFTAQPLIRVPEICYLEVYAKEEDRRQMVGRESSCVPT